MKNCLLLGRKVTVLATLKEQIERKDINLTFGTSLEEVENAFKKNQFEVVIMGAGLELVDRLEIINYIFTTSKSTTVHMKDWDSGPGGMIPFVNGILNGLTD
ncbi:MAG: hypothetical protein GQ574_03395 [Crocinitomix sp.]|nr:hypothetical protein [Crocinitomix sp.]